MPQFNNMASLKSYLNTAVNSALKNEVGSIVKDVINDETGNTVYSVYNPKQYERRYDNRGLGDESLISVTPNTSDNSIIVRDEAHPNGISDQYLDDMIVNGYGNQDEIWNSPRDFYSAAEDDLRQTGAHIKALAEGLNRQGIQTT